jgi:hypothetical protein
MNDVELELWRAQWQTAAPPPPDLRDRVERETRMMRRFVVGEIVVTLVFGGGSVTWAVLSRRTDAMLLALGVWVFIAVAWTISFLLRRDAWSPVTLSTAAFLDLSILRCRRRREAIVAQGVLYVLILAFDLAWIYFFGREPGSRDVPSFLTSGSVVWVWLVTAMIGIAALRRRQRLTRELETLTRLRVGLDNDTRHPKGEELWESRIKNVKGFGKRKRRGGWFVRN